MTGIFLAFSLAAFKHKKKTKQIKPQVFLVQVFTQAFILIFLVAVNDIS